MERNEESILAFYMLDESSSFCARAAVHLAASGEHALAEDTRWLAKAIYEHGVKVQAKLNEVHIGTVV